MQRPCMSLHRFLSYFTRFCCYRYIVWLLSYSLCFTSNIKLVFIFTSPCPTWCAASCFCIRTNSNTHNVCLTDSYVTNMYCTYIQLTCNVKFLVSIYFKNLLSCYFLSVFNEKYISHFSSAYSNPRWRTNVMYVVIYWSDLQYFLLLVVHGLVHVHCAGFFMNGENPLRLLIHSFPIQIKE